jgi:hypothetical protein
MRKIITGASIILIFVSTYALLKTVFASPQLKSTASKAVATSPTPGPQMLLASTATTPDPSQESTSTPTPVSTSTAEPINVRVVKHQPDQFRKGAISSAELSAIEKAIKTIPWSRNSNPQAAAKEDYAAIVKECRNSGVHDLLIDLITEAVSNEYQPNNEAANSAYSTELNLDLENGDQSEHSQVTNTVEMTEAEGTSVDKGLPPTVSPPQVQANATPLPSPEQSAPAEVVRSKVSHVRHHSIVRHKTLDVRARLLALWHQSLRAEEKSAKVTLFSDSHKPQTPK